MLQALEQDGVSHYLYKGTQFRWGKAAIPRDAHKAFFRFGQSTQPPYGISDFELEKCQDMYTFKEMEYKIESPDGKYVNSKSSWSKIPVIYLNFAKIWLIFQSHLSFMFQNVT